MTNNGRIFISHGSEDREEADGIARFIEERGMRAWIAPRDVRPGQDYSEQLQEAIEQCAAFIILVSERSNKSPYVRVETELAFSGNKPIFPVRTSDVAPGAGLALFLKIKHWTDAFGPQRDHNLARLAEELQMLTRQEGADEAPPAADSGPPPPPLPPPAPAPAPVQGWSAGPAAGVAPAAPLEGEAALRSFIGPNATYYLGKWRDMDSSGSRTSWNWAAFFLNGLWLAYRRMWKPALIFGGLFVGLALVATAAYAGLGGETGALVDLLRILVVLGVAVWIGLNGNRLYRAHVGAALAGGAERTGGTSVGAAIGYGVAVVLLAGVPLAIVTSRLAAEEQLTPDGPGVVDPSVNGSGGGKDPAGASATLTADYLVGRWADDGQCGNAFEFGSDGTVYLPDGSEAQWSLSGDTLTLSGPNGEQSARIEVLDENRFRADGGDVDTVRC